MVSARLQQISFALVTYLLFSLSCFVFIRVTHYIPTLWQLCIYTVISLMVGGLILYLLTDESQREQKVQKEAVIFEQQHDSITTLPNRRYFIEYLTQRLKNDNLHPFALITIGIDRFPQINHALGHLIGDRLLNHVGHRLYQAFSHAELFARFASNVFIASLPNITPDNFHEEAERIIELFEKPVSVYTLNIDLDILMGFSFYPSDGIDADSLIQKADLALFNAKNSANRYSVYLPEKDPFHVNQISLMSELREGLSQNQFAVFYQPKVNLMTGKATQVEALIRWQHPVKGFMSPEKFIPLAEETGHIKKLTFWLIEKAIAQCQQWHQQQIPLGISLNLSVKDLLNKKLPNHVKQLIKEYGIDPNKITFEITESAFMHEPALVASVIHKLKTLGVNFSLDDFGSGFSSLKYLMQLAVNELKIDKSFIQEITQSERVARIVESTIQLAHSINMTVVAEGLIDQKTLNILKNFDCDLGQGFLFCEPLPLPDFTQWLQTSSWGIKYGN